MPVFNFQLYVNELQQEHCPDTGGQIRIQKNLQSCDEGAENTCYLLIPSNENPTRAASLSADCGILST